MARSSIYGLAVVALLGLALGGLFGEEEAPDPVVVAEAGTTTTAEVLISSTGAPTTTSTMPHDEREPDVDVLGRLVRDHLGTTTTIEEAELHSAAQPVGDETTGTTAAPAPPASTAPPQTTTTTPPKNSGGPSGEMESQFAGLINSYRANNGLGKLTRDGSLDARARAWSERMAANQGLSHSDLGSLLGTWSSAAENVGMGGSVDSVFGALAGSSGHSKNMLGAFTHYGVGVWVDSAGVIWTTHLFAG